uniref:Vacuolar iron transporter n=1 Tax=Oryza rufipogon TaxID=4529 RepID=A0A0E0NIE5_ORYRU
MAIDLGCHVGCASPETKQEETADPTAAPVVVDDVEAAAGGRRPGDGGGVNYVARAQWLRAAVLGANDGLVSVASLMVGVGAANGTRRAMLVSGLAGLVAGACSMAIGEFVSVYAQCDIQAAQIERARGGKDADGGEEEEELPSPTMAAVASALSFAAGGGGAFGRGRPGSRPCARRAASASPASAWRARTSAARASRAPASGCSWEGGSPWRSRTGCLSCSGCMVFNGQVFIFSPRK